MDSGGRAYWILLTILRFLMVELLISQGDCSMRYLGVVFLILGPILGLLIGFVLDQRSVAIYGCVGGALLGALIFDWTRRKEKKGLPLPQKEAQRLRIAKDEAQREAVQFYSHSHGHHPGSSGGGSR